MRANTSGTIRFLVMIAVLAFLGQALACQRTHPEDLDEGEPDTSPGSELVQNPGFEEPGSPAAAWTRDMAQTGGEGNALRDEARFHSGHASLKLEPNNRNGGSHPLAVAQIIPASRLRGRKVEFSGYLAADGGATAVLAVLSVVHGRPGQLEAVFQPSSGSGWTRQHTAYVVPDDASVQLVIACSVSGHAGAAWFDDVSVVPYTVAKPSAPSARSSASAGPLKASVEVDAGRILRQIPRTLYGANVEWIWNGNEMWLEKERKPNPEIVRLTRDLGVTLIRYPGGVFSDFYHWKDGAGPYDRRPEVLHQAGSSDRSRPNFGIDEALEFAQEIGGQLLITVNAGTGTAQEAADWVHYVNGRSLRVTYWEVGNELYINDGSAASKAISVDPATYAARFRQFAQAMRAADSRIKIGAIGGENRGRYAFVNYPDWDRIVLERAGDQMDFLAVHNAYAPVNPSDGDDFRSVYSAMLAAPVLIARNLRTVGEQIGRYAPSRASNIAIAVTEWGPLFQVDPSGRYVNHTVTLGSALYAASVLKVLVESTRTQIANFHVLNDLAIMGWIGTRNASFPPNPDWAPTARYYAFQMYTRHFGELLVQSAAEGPAYDSLDIGAVDAVTGVPYLDIVSSLSTDKTRLYILGINKNFDAPVDAALSIRGFAPASKGVVWTLTGTGVDAHTGTKPLQIPGMTWGRQAEDPQNPRYAKGGPSEVTLTSSALTDGGARFTYRFPAHSVASLVLTQQ
jgi:alpha-N-arabinofuranosidase